MRETGFSSKDIEGRHPIRRFWENYRWLIIIIGVVAVFALGAVGFAEYLSTKGKFYLPDILYNVFQLFVLNFDIRPDHPNWMLEIARWLAPITTAYAALKAMALIFREQFQLFRLDSLSKHIIICGLGRKGLLLTRRFREDGYMVVVIENDENNERLEQCRDSGAIVLIGNAMDSDILNRARLKKAEYLFCICGDDGINAGISFNARTLLHGKRNKPLTCLVHIVDPQLCRLLKEQEFTTEVNDSFRQEFFNLFDFAARAIIEIFPPFEHDEGKIKAATPHLLIVGLGNLGENVAVHAARKWPDLAGKSDKKLKISIVDRAAEQKRDLLNRRYPWLSEVWELDPLQMEISSKEYEDGRFLFDLKKTRKMAIVYVCLDNDSFALKAALCLHQLLRDHNIPIVVRMARETGLAPLIEGDTHGFANIRVFGFLDRVLKPELLFSGTHEILARSIHEEYRRDRFDKGETVEDNPSLISWEYLPDTIKNSNRRQADYMGVKLKTVGCYIVPMIDWKINPVKFTLYEIESMAKLEHEHWMEERLKDGWKYGPKDSNKKTSPVLVPWENLSEDEKDKDRNPVREMPNFLARAGFQIYRRRT